MSSDNIDNDNSFDSYRPFLQNTSTDDVKRKILLATIVSFSIIVIIVFCYQLYARFMLHSRRFSFTIVSHPLERGLNSSVIVSLPTFIVGVNGDDDVADTECAVCLTLFEEKDTAKILPNCKHVFHVTCVDTWLATSSTCPVCRSEVEPSQRLEPEPREGPVGYGAPPLDFVAVAEATSSSDDKTGGLSVLRLDSFRRILTRERSSGMNNHSCVDQNRVLDLERQ